MSFSNLNLKLKAFEPLLPVMTGHSQTILGHIIPSKRPDFVFAGEVLPLSDGDEMYLEYINNNSPFTISVFHGLAGSSQADYMYRSAQLAGDLGWNIILVNHRGANVLAKAAKTYHSGRGEDADAVLRWSRRKFPETKQIALGFSMSGSILLNLLCRRYGDEQPDFAVVVNAPLDLEKCTELLTKGLSNIYDLRFYLMLKKMIQEKQDVRLPLYGRTIDIDEAYTSKVNGFLSARDYYEKCSTVKFLNRIETKTFVLTAKDDPFIAIGDYISADWNSNVHLTLQAHGGHMGYFARKKDPRYGHRWLDHYLESVLKAIQTF